MSLETKNWVGSKLASGRYEVISELGAGGMAFVYLAHDHLDGRKVVIKVPRQAMLEDPAFTARFVREAKSLVRLTHPHIVKIVDAGKRAGRPFLVMEFLSGGSLRDRLQHRRSSVADLETWLPGIASALDFCHANNCVHRDVKPDNILFDAAGKPYLSDFGIAKVLSQTPNTKMTVLTSAGMVLGTPQYMAPELVMGHSYDGKADQYALAVTVYECLTGQTPFVGNTAMAVVVEQSTKEAPALEILNPAVSKDVAVAVHRSLAKNPNERLPDCTALAKAISAARSEFGQGDIILEAISCVTCPACRKRFTVPPTAMARKLRCPACKTAIAPLVKPTGKNAAPSESLQQEVAQKETMGNSGNSTQKARPHRQAGAVNQRNMVGGVIAIGAAAFGFALVVCLAIGIWAFFRSPSREPSKAKVLEHQTAAGLKDHKSEPNKVVLPPTEVKDLAKAKDNNIPKSNPDKVVRPPTEVKDLAKDKDIPKKKTPIPPTNDGSNNDGAKKDGVKKPPVFINKTPPRRALLISVNNYLMFNTVHYGSPADSFKNGYPGSSTGVLRDRLTRPPMNFPVTQVFELSDGAPDVAKSAKPHSTRKSALETTIHDFAETSRQQDRIMILFAGHATTFGGQSYLVPIDGNLAKPESLLPLNWVFNELSKCKAQQKILVLDLFRFSPSRGFELPSAGEGAEGTMPEDFNKDLQSPPAGVQVLASCQGEQCSVELDGGSAFMQAFCHSSESKEMTDSSGPEQAIPIDTLVWKINQRLKDLLISEKRTQVARLTGTAGNAVGYKANEPPAPPITLKEPTFAGGNVAKAAQINSILDELRIIPPVRETRAGDVNLLRAQNLPAFSADKLGAYNTDGYQGLADLEQRYKSTNNAFTRDFPLRAAYFEALTALQDSQKVRMREVLSSPVNPKSKAVFLLEQEPLGISIFRLKGALAATKEANEKREMETSKRWQANFDYMQARLQSRLIYLFEYNYTLGQIRADNLPELALGQSGWRIGISGPKLNVTENDARDLAKKTKKLWDDIENRYPDTPWSLLAQRESKITIGLTWRAKSD